MENQQFIESIKLLNGDVYHLAYHQERVCRTFSHFFPSEKILSLQESISKIALPAIGKYKIRIVYNQKDYTIEVLPYQLKPINTIKCVNADEYDYSYKFLNREFHYEIGRASCRERV